MGSVLSIFLNAKSTNLFLRTSNWFIHFFTLKFSALHLLVN